MESTFDNLNNVKENDEIKLLKERLTDVLSHDRALINQVQLTVIIIVLILDRLSKEQISNNTTHFGTMCKM